MSEQWTLGQLTEFLAKHQEAEWVQFDFCDLVPNGLLSYRGYYEELALGYRNPDSNHVTPQHLLQICREADGGIFTGYKGGEFQMGADTPVWVANYGWSSSTAIVGIRDEGFMLVIETVYLSR